MLTPQDVRAAQFEKNIRGYRTEEVDRFLDKVEEQLKQDEDQAEELRRQIAELTAENQRLHKEMESYEADGDMLKSALINAQRMGENVIREANQKSEEILHRANLRGDDIIRDANELLQKASDRADEIINEANEKKLAQEREYDRVRLEVTRFKSDVLNLYRSHVESLSRLPEFQKEEPAEDAPAEDEAAAAETTAAAVTEEIAESLAYCDSVVLESNHDVEMLRSGPYPPALKARILSDYGHLSNDVSSRVAAYLASCGTKNIILAHLSEHNNTPELAYAASRRALDEAGYSFVRLEVADSSKPTVLI